MTVVGFDHSIAALGMIRAMLLFRRRLFKNPGRQSSGVAFTMYDQDIMTKYRTLLREGTSSRKYELLRELMVPMKPVESTSGP